MARPVAGHYDSQSTKLIAIAPEKSGSCWLIPETDAIHLPVYAIDVKDVQRLLDGCPFFEYNLIAKDFSWLLIETEHNDYYICRAEATT